MKTFLVLDAGSDADSVTVPKTEHYWWKSHPFTTKGGKSTWGPHGIYTMQNPLWLRHMHHARELNQFTFAVCRLLLFLGVFLIFVFFICKVSGKKTTVNGGGMADAEKHPVLNDPNLDSTISNKRVSKTTCWHSTSLPSTSLPQWTFWVSLHLFRNYSVHLPGSIQFQLIKFSILRGKASPGWHSC